MLIAKHLPSAKDARIYMSVERTYLGYIRFSLYTLSFGVFLRKLEILSDFKQVIHVSVLIDFLAKASAVIGVILIVTGLLTFYLDLKYLDGGVEVSPKETTDPRIYMASERTFLAWIRTAIALIVFGFVIEKFEFFLKQLKEVFNFPIKGNHDSLIGIGLFIIIVGLLTLALGTLNFYRTIRQVDEGRYRTHTWLYKAYGLIIFLACLVLTFHILRVI
ncbi:uncharacterized membrane protein YidH (DUF202 family) [Hydrogenivirga caldilitoris]|uniref:Uncharacterized membrane protein YidH (DUF202 family) n=1 Tax=Hydrogenivirga caldilitoris TaxID=246264 RepID=A0A497XS89_9AQUI|nr:DUF202 domain-containing protein [Hydrogenivirga caldilitoris]RLJ70969.1 uncharacterized membrane protein YidH (DUF202 family) [Hydrogenivirga caldilitoris]